MPDHVVTVSDRLIITSGGYRELDDDKYKHLILLTDDARLVISFAGFAGILGRGNLLKETMLDWLTKVIQNTSKNGHHNINQHLNDIRDHANDYIDKLKKHRIPSTHLPLAIQISGWIGYEQFHCVIENCLNKQGVWSDQAGSGFTTRWRNYGTANFEQGNYVLFLGNDSHAKKEKELCEMLLNINENPKKIFHTSVNIIRAVAPKSDGTIGVNCSGIRMSKNDPGIEVYDDRNTEIYDVVMPNCILSKSSISATVSNMKGRKTQPKQPFRLLKLVLPKEANTTRKKVEFWFRAVERLRLLHNQQSAKLGDNPTKDQLDRFHKWQRDIFEPVSDAAHNQLNLVKAQLVEEDPDTYACGDIFSGDPFRQIKEEQKITRAWDNYIDLGDVKLFKLEE